MRTGLSRQTALVTTGLLLLAATPALANAGTALMYAGILHLVFLNALIGGIEGAITRVAVPPGPPRQRVVLYLLGANYASAILGATYLGLLMPGIQRLVLGDDPLQRLPWLMLAAYLAAFVLTLLVEWPFVLWAVRPRNGDERPANSRRVLRYFLGANLLTYALLALFYVWPSRISAITELRPVTDLSFVQEKSARVLYEDGASGRLVVQRLDGTPPHPAQGSWEEAYEAAKGGPEATVPRDFGRGADLRREVTGRWERVWTDVWAAGGLSIEGRDGSRARWALEAPFFFWYARWATLLPGDQVVYQFGDYIAVLDLNTHQIATLARGRKTLVSLPRLDRAGQKASSVPEANIPTIKR